MLMENEMVRNGSDESHPPLVRRLAEQAVAAELFEAIVDGAGQASTEPAMDVLLAYARRPHDAPADLAIENAIRTNPTVSRRYRNLLAIMAQAVSRVAYAAAADKVPPRTIGAWRLRVSAPQGLSPVLVLEQREAAPAPAAIEAIGADGQIRLVLPEPVNQAIQLPLNEDVPELAAFHRLLENTATEIFLL
jgi:hypothetical protein